MRRIRGITLVELLVAAAIFALIAGALAQTLFTVIHYELTAPSQQQAFDSQVQFEDRMRAILQAAYLSPTATDQSTYLIGTVGGQNPNGQPNLAAAEATPGSTAATQAASASNSGTTAQAAISNGSADGIVLTVLGQQIPPNYLEATGVPLNDDGNGGNNTAANGGTQNFQQAQSMPNGQEVVQDTETLNSTYGAEGGPKEISISQTPVGNPTQGTGDVYIRIQTPADADYTQGGVERVFDANISKIQFEFFDGLQWDGGWDTTSSGGRHLPAAIRVHYWLKSDPNSEHMFVVWLPLSDLTPANPLSSVATTTSTGSTGGAPAGAAGASERVLPVLPGVLSPFSNLEVVPDNALAETQPDLDMQTVLAPNLLSVKGADGIESLAPPGSLQPWQEPPGRFAFRPQDDPLLPYRIVSPEAAPAKQMSTPAENMAKAATKKALGAEAHVYAGGPQ